MNEQYKRFLKEAKARKISTRDKLTDLVYEMYENCTGGEFECAVSILKIKR